MKSTWPTPEFCVGTQRNLYSTGLRLGFASGKTQILGLTSGGDANLKVHVGTQRNLYSTGLRLGFASGKTQILGLTSGGDANLKVRVGSRIPTCWYLQPKILASGALPNANPRRQVFCVAVEYRLKVQHRDGFSL